MIIILMLCMSLFFCLILINKASATKDEKEFPPSGSMKKYQLDPMDELNDELRFSQCDDSKSTCLNQKPKTEKSYAKESMMREMVSDYPIEEMIPEIAKLAKTDEKAAFFLIAIAKKESDWGRLSPSKNGKSCFNYWGYKGRQNPTAGGYSCFSSMNEAVTIVGGKLTTLIEKGLDTADELLVWKCGASCKNHNPKDVGAWVGSINKYYSQLAQNNN